MQIKEYLCIFIVALCLAADKCFAQNSTTTRATTTTTRTTTSTTTTRPTTTTSTTTTTTTTTKPPIMEPCGDACKNGQVYIILQSYDIKIGSTDVFQAYDRTIFSQISIETQDLSTINFMLIQQIFTDKGTIDSSYQLSLKPTLNRLDINAPLIIFTNQSTICILFEQNCQTDCFAIPQFILDNNRRFTYNTQFSVRRNTFRTGNKSEVYFSSEKCKGEMFNDPDLGYLTSLKEHIMEIYEKTLQTFSYFGFNGGSGSNFNPEDRIYQKPFCQKYWKNYDLIQTVYAKVAPSNSTSGVLDAILLENGTFCVLKYIYESKMQTYTYVIDYFDKTGRFISAQNFALPSTDSDYMRLSNLAVDNQGNFYIYIETKNVYLFKRQASFPYALVKRSVVPLTNSSYGRLKFNPKTRDLFVFFYQNAFVFDLDLNFKKDIPVVNSYGDYVHNGFYWYASEGSSVYRYDEVKQEVTVKRVRNSKSTYYNRVAIVNECVLVGLGTSYTTGSADSVMDFVLLNGSDMYSGWAGFTNAYGAAISTDRDGKIYVFDSDKMSMSIYDYART